MLFGIGYFKGSHISNLCSLTLLNPQLLVRKKSFNTINDIWDELLLIEESDKFSLGQQLFYLVPLFANSDNIITDEDIQMINEYHYVTEYNIPLGTTLDETDAHKLSMFNIVKSEMGLALKHKADKNGNTKS